MKWNKNFKNYVNFLKTNLKRVSLTDEAVYVVYRCMDVINDILDNPFTSTEQTAERLGVQIYAIRNKLRELKKFDIIFLNKDSRTPLYFPNAMVFNKHNIDLFNDYTVCSKCKNPLKNKNILLFENKSLNITKVFCSKKCREEYLFDRN